MAAESHPAQLSSPRDALSALRPAADFVQRHVGSAESDLAAMLAAVGVADLDALIDQTVPDAIRLRRPLALPPAQSESEVLAEIRELAAHNPVWRSFIGLGYSGTLVPAVIQRNILENPGWYTQYTPYQAEISQGRLEMLLNFQTMVSDLAGLEVANASLLDEATAAAEAMTMMRRVNSRSRSDRFVVSDGCHPQTLAVLETRARPLGIELVVDAPERLLEHGEVFGVLLQVPDTWGRVFDYRELAAAARARGALVAVATDLLALCVLAPPGAMGADVAFGSAQRFGVPLGYGGPHPAFFATREAHKRQVPGRIVGVSRDAHGALGLRLALQTREQHIRRERATSNICTAQVLLAIMATAYAIYHGPERLRRQAERVHRMTEVLRAGLRELGHVVAEGPVFDTLRVEVSRAERSHVLQCAAARRLNLRATEPEALGVSLDETTLPEDLRDLLAAFGDDGRLDLEALAAAPPPAYPPGLGREGELLTHPIFRTYHSETEMLRYLQRLQARDLSLTTSMIPLGSCTMKLNATAEMVPVTLPGFSEVHPFAPLEQAAGYRRLIDQLGAMLLEITGFDAVSFMPNAGSQGEYSGLLVIRAWHEANGQGQRDVCLIPESAHGTNPASAVMAGLRVVVVGCDERGDIDLDDLEKKAAQHADALAAIMLTYPSTHGVFEGHVGEACGIVHAHGGQVYLDGANLNAQVGLCRPADYGADVCHLNLHKTFSIPHGGGGPGMGPIAVANHLAPFLPTHPLVATGGERGVGPVSAAPFGSASILPISWMYLRLLGAAGATRATQVALLNANYMAARLEGHYPIVFRGERGRVAHEFVLDCRHFERSANVRVEDIAKRLMDYGFHAPTMSWPIPGTLMIEPTESESKAELDRFCEAMIAIREEIRRVEVGEWPQSDNPLVNAPHAARDVMAEGWAHPYSREEAAFPAAWTREHKYWPPLGRIDNAYGDRNLVCACPPLEAYGAS